MAPEPEPPSPPKRAQRRRKAHHSYRTRASRTEALEREFEVRELFLQKKNRLYFQFLFVLFGSALPYYAVVNFYR